MPTRQPTESPAHPRLGARKEDSTQGSSLTRFRGLIIQSSALYLPTLPSDVSDVYRLPYVLLASSPSCPWCEPLSSPPDGVTCCRAFAPQYAPAAQDSSVMPMSAVPA